MKRAVFALMAAVVLASAGRSTGADDPALQAMRDELHRSMTELRLDKAESPYFIAYRVDDSDSYHMAATVGALTSSTHLRHRGASVDLRVGSYQLDNSGFIGLQTFTGTGISSLSLPLPLDDDYSEWRRTLWLLTDAAYKQALEMMAQKKAVLQTRASTPTAPDFSTQPPVTVVEPRVEFRIDLPRWEGEVRRLSAVFRGFPAIQSSGVHLSAQLLHRYFVNSEGTTGLEPHRMVVLTAEATTQSADGMKFSDSVSFFARTAEELPPEATMAAGVGRLARNLTAVRTAPKMTSYSGPVLLAPDAAAAAFAQILAPQLSGQRAPLFQQEQLSAMLDTHSTLADSLNQPVLPPFLTVKDDPADTVFHQLPLLGGYRLDAQGVPVRPLTLVDRGILKTLLMTRTPRPDIPHSNGHAKAGWFGLDSAGASNLLIVSSAGHSAADLKQQLMARCREQHLPYGILVRTLQGSMVSSDPMAMMAMLRGQGASVAPGLMYRVWVADGREERVRGAVIEGLSAKTMKHILATGVDYAVHHGATGDSGILGSLQTDRSSLTSVVAPAVLLEDVDVKPATQTAQTPPLLTSPGF